MNMLIIILNLTQIGIQVLHQILVLVALKVLQTQTIVSRGPYEKGGTGLFYFLMSSLHHQLTLFLITLRLLRFIHIFNRFVVKIK